MRKAKPSTECNALHRNGVPTAKTTYTREKVKHQVGECAFISRTKIITLCEDEPVHCHELYQQYGIIKMGAACSQLIFTCHFVRDTCPLQNEIRDNNLMCHLFLASDTSTMNNNKQQQIECTIAWKKSVTICASDELIRLLSTAPIVRHK